MALLTHGPFNTWPSIYELFVGTNETVRIMRVSVERGSTVSLWLHNKSRLSLQKKNKVKWFGTSLVFT